MTAYKKKDDKAYSLDEWKSDEMLESIMNSMELQSKTVDHLLEKVEELNNKVVNMANKLEDHLNERDAHNPAMMGKKS